MKHTGPISSVATHGCYVATGGYDNRVILWDAVSHQALALAMHDHLVNHCEFSHDGQWLVTASSDYSARIWELPQLRLHAVLSDHNDNVDMATCSPDNQFVATCALDRAVRLFDLSGHCLKTFLGHTGNIISLLWSIDGKRLISSSVDGSVREWDVERGTQLSCYDLDGVRTDTIAIDSQGRILAGDDRGRIAIISQGQLTYHQAHQAGIKKVVFCEDQQLLVTLSCDRTLAFWQISPTGAVSQRQRANMPDVIWPRAAALLGKDQLVLGTFGSRYAIYDWRIDLWRSNDIEIGPGINAITYHQDHVYTVGDAGIVLKDGQPYAYLGSLCNFLLSAGSQLFSGGQLGELFDVHTGKSLYQYYSPLNCGVFFYRHNQAHLAIGTYTGEMLIFSINDDQSVKFEQVLSVFENAIKGIAVNQQLFSVCASTDIAWHDSQDLRLIKKQSKAHDKIANACCAIGDQGLASVSRDLHLRLWLDGQTDSYLTPHLNSVKCIAASADGQMLMTGSYTGTVAGFDLAERHWHVFERPTHAGISALSYDPVKRCFLATSYDGQIYPIAH